MIPEPDPSLWTKISTWLWALPTAMIAIMWKKSDNAATKEELAREHEYAEKNIVQLYQNAEDDRKLTRDGFDKVLDTIHNVHIDLLNKIK